MLERISNIICQYVEEDPKNITMETNLIEDLGINSYDLVSLAAAVEEDFGLVIPDRDILGFVSVGDVVEYISDNI